MNKYRSNLYPFSPTKACDPPIWRDFSRSPFFSEQEFEDLLLPHTPKLLNYDQHLQPIEKTVWFFTFSFLPYNENLLHGNGFKFESTLTNNVYALLYRVLAVPEVKSPTEIRYPTDWFDVPPVDFNYSIHEAEWLDNLKPHQKKRCTQAYDTLKFTVAWPKTLDMFAKCNELLLAKAKPRIIWNVPPLLQSFLGPLFRQVTFHMKEHFDGLRRYEYQGKKFTILFACGVDSSVLSQWANYSLARLLNGDIHWAGVFLGDDSLVLYLKDGLVCSIENDFSAYDSTQRDAVQRRLSLFYKKMGIPEIYRDACLHISGMALRVRYGSERQYSFKIKLPTMQTATGKPDTCVGNTLMNMDSTIQFMAGACTYEDYGFVAKQKHNSPWTRGTFLKGFWCLNQEGVYSWNALPSQTIKLLKAFTYCGEPFEELLKKNLSSVGYSQTPLISTLLKRFRVEFNYDINMFRIFGAERVPLDEANLAEFLEDRYQVKVSLFSDLENLLSTAPVGSNISHPLWFVLASTDYGDGGGSPEFYVA